ncbi:hypothetical protein ACWDZ4_28030, partial [Streptomyces sp. NPDC003016]
MIRRYRSAPTVPQGLWKTSAAMKGPGPPRCHTYRISIDSHRCSIEGEMMGRLTVLALRAVLVVLLAGSLFVQTV